MLTLPLLAYVPFLAAGTPAPALDPVVETRHAMPLPNWIDPLAQRPREGAPQGYIQGLLGFTELRVRDLDLDPALGGPVDSDDMTLPLVGGAVQRPLRGERLHLGVEGGFLLGWEGNVEAVVIGSGGAVIAADNDLLTLEAFGGGYADLLLGEKLRVYAGAGGLIDFASMDLEYSDPVLGHVNVDECGFGLGVYTRLGAELLLQSGMRIGFCWRWFEADLDLGGRIDNLELDGQQYMLTFTKSL